MQIHVSGHQIEVTPALHDYVMSKMERISRHFENLIGVHIILNVEKLDHKAEAIISLSQKQIHADSKANDMYAAIDALADKLDSQIRKHKEKLRDHHREEAKKDR